MTCNNNNIDNDNDYIMIHNNICIEMDFHLLASKINDLQTKTISCPFPSKNVIAGR